MDAWNVFNRYDSSVHNDLNLGTIRLTLIAQTCKPTSKQNMVPTATPTVLFDSYTVTCINNSSQTIPKLFKAGSEESNNHST